MIKFEDMTDDMTGKLQVVSHHAAGVAKRIENVYWEVQIEVAVV